MSKNRRKSEIPETPKVSRRRWLGGAGAIGVGVVFGVGCDNGPHLQFGSTDGGADSRVEPVFVPGAFLHGVASGDPLSDRVMLWTRFSPEQADTTMAPVEWRIATDPGMTAILASGVIETGAYRDFTVKVDVIGLSPASTYYYQFRAGTAESLVGRTRTLPVGSVDRLRLAVVSCSSFAHGYFHVYRHLAENADLDAVLHLGDYIYEYGDNQYGSLRTYDPPHEILTLDDYRRRYRHYRRDTDLQAVHQQHPFIVVWDDHETANDAWRNGAQNHDAREGDFAARARAATQAYFEWLPIREQGAGNIWRSFTFGDLAHLVMLDTRRWGRDAPVANAAAAEEPGRQILGADQERWLHDQLTQTSARWKLLGQQVIVSPISDTPTMYRPPSDTLDAWNGFTAARTRFLDELAAVENPIILTGDVHSHWAIDVAGDPFTDYDHASGRGSIAVEFVTSAVSSPAFPDEALSMLIEPALRNGNPHAHYINLLKRGYILLNVTHAATQADYYVIDGVEATQGALSLERSFTVATGERHLVRVEGAVTPRAAPPMLAPGAPPRNL